MRRDIGGIFTGEAVTEGAGVRLRRVFGYFEAPRFDPFLLLDDFRCHRREDFIKGFPWHPHRGIETITYVLDGDVAHGDSLGNAGVIGAGDVQWMTAGSGIIHQEMPKGNKDEAMLGFQLWANLPASQKMMEPRYRDVRASDIPEVRRADGSAIKIIAGEVDGVRGPVRDIVIEPHYLDCDLPPHTAFTHSTRRGDTVFIYVIGGEATVEGRTAGDKTLVLFDDGDELAVKSSEQGVRFLLVSGRPLDEPISWRGPIVMNTDKEIKLAYEELRAETFIKHG